MNKANFHFPMKGFVHLLQHFVFINSFNTMNLLICAIILPREGYRKGKERSSRVGPGSPSLKVGRQTQTPVLHL